MPSALDISINVTDTDSPLGVRRRIHLRSLSDVTPASRAHTTRARSHSERPRAPPASPPGPAALCAGPPPRAVRSERSSPNASFLMLDRADPGCETRQRLRDRHRSDTVTGNPWRKMSEVDLKSVGGRDRVPNHASFDGTRAFDPWVKVSTPQPASDAPGDRALTGEVESSTPESNAKSGRATKRGKLERRSPVVCESCGNESCECWRPRATPPAPAPLTPRAARAPAAGGPLIAYCTCEARSPRPSPARLLPRPPVRAFSDDEERPRRLYKSTSQKVICSSTDVEYVKKPSDPLLETTC